MERDEMTKESLETSSPIIQRLPSIKTVACTIRVPRNLRKNSPNVWKCSQNCSQNIKAQIESPKQIHPTVFNFKISATFHVLKLHI
jgi:hypothetical protein